MDTKELAREHREHSVLTGHPSLALYFASAFFSLSGMFRKLEMMELQQQQQKKKKETKCSCPPSFHLPFSFIKLIST